MKTCGGGVKDHLHVILTTALDGAQWCGSHPGGKNTPALKNGRLGGLKSRYGHRQMRDVE
jgi:hypothetical protein